MALPALYCECYAAPPRAERPAHRGPSHDTPRPRRVTSLGLNRLLLAQATPPTCPSRKVPPMPRESTPTAPRPARFLNFLGNNFRASSYSVLLCIEGLAYVAFLWTEFKSQAF